MEWMMDAKSPEEVVNHPLFRGLVDAISDGVVAMNAQTRAIIGMNEVARNFLDYKESDTVGCQCSQMMNAPICATACPLTAILTGEQQSDPIELYYRGKGGQKMLHAHTKMILVRDLKGQPLVGIELFRDVREVRSLRKSLEERRSLQGIVGKSPVMQTLYDSVEQLAPYPIPVMLRGESGVGKERIADALHALSLRADRPFIKVNCAALSPMLIESELFGHCQGAFTGASQARKGWFEEADGGTLLLDEVGDLPFEFQAKLLRVVETGEVQRVGEDKVRHVDVRIICATNRTLEASVEQGTFRQDLYYRLHVGVIQIPPLRDRLQDIPLLVEHFLHKLNEQWSPENPWFLDELALQVLIDHTWPGNVRELKNCIQLAVIRAGRNQPRILPMHLFPASGARPADVVLPLQNIEQTAPVQTLAEAEESAIKRAMHQTDGNISAAARLLAIDRSTLWRKLKKMQM